MQYSLKSQNEMPGPSLSSLIEALQASKRTDLKDLTYKRGAIVWLGVFCPINDSIGDGILLLKGMR